MSIRREDAERFIEERQDGSSHDEQDRARSRSNHPSRCIERGFRLASLRERAPRRTEDECELKRCNTHHHDGGTLGGENTGSRDSPSGFPRDPGHERSQCSLRASPKAYFASAHVPMVANSPTKIPDGMVELLPSLLDPTKSEPQTAVTATAIHIAVIASDAQTSLRRSSEAQLYS